MHFYITNMCSKEVHKCTITSNEAFLAEIANSNVKPMLHGFRRDLYFESQV